MKWEEIQCKIEDLNKEVIKLRESTKGLLLKNKQDNALFVVDKYLNNFNEYQTYQIYLQQGMFDKVELRFYITYIEEEDFDNYESITKEEGLKYLKEELINIKNRIIYDRGSEI